MWLKWLPWRYLVSSGAKARGFLDPLTIAARLARFSQPSEVAEPIELLRAGVVFHARGLINTRAIQHNLDWVWPYWVERQFDPGDISFLPRAFSITHVNLTHRNWTALGIPGLEEMPIVDPRGLLTPHFDGWSLDMWLLGRDGQALLPSRLLAAEQRLLIDGTLALETVARGGGFELKSRAAVVLSNARPVLELEVRGVAPVDGQLVFSVRPYNPEGVSFVNELEVSSDMRRVIVNRAGYIDFAEAPDGGCALSNYRSGDVYSRLPSTSAARSISCEVGLASGAACFSLAAHTPRTCLVRIPLSTSREAPAIVSRAREWRSCQMPEARFPDSRMEFLLGAAVRTLLLLSPLDPYPGPFTYKRFWFRDAAFTLHALLCCGYFEEAQRAIERFPARQDRSGYMLSQEGEWDSNGEVLWLIGRYVDLSGEKPPQGWRDMVRKAADWISRKRLSGDQGGLHKGLLPAGFSAEHLGPNDYYFWDDYWGVAGLQAAGRLMLAYGDESASARYEREAALLAADIERSLALSPNARAAGAIPASPYRRMDSGAIGSVVASYPLQVLPSADPRMLKTLQFFLDRCLVRGGFFQDMIHSGINPYLTLHIAQALLRAGDARYWPLVETVAGLASPTGQWPEAIHPHTLGGCMGDGQHGWASAEWLMMIRNIFVREEGERVLLFSGVPRAWLSGVSELVFGPTWTPHGPIKLRARAANGRLRIRWEFEARAGRPAPVFVIALPGADALTIAPDAGEAEISLPPADSDRHKPAAGNGMSAL